MKSRITVVFETETEADLEAIENAVFEGLDYSLEKNDIANDFFIVDSTCQTY